METLVDAFAQAAPVWEQAIEQVGWLHVLLLAAYFGVAWLCFLNGHLAGQAKDGTERSTVWVVATVLLCLLGVNTLLQLDVLLTATLRALARLDGWYAQRRMLQYQGLAALALLLLLSWKHWRAAYVAATRDAAPVALGLALVLLLLLLRMVSAHGTDALLNLGLLGFSLGRWLELCSLGLVLLGAWRGLRLR